MSLRSLTTMIFLSIALTLVGCDTNKKKGSSKSATNFTSTSLEVNGDSDSGKAGDLRTVYFDFNSSRLSSSARETLEANASYLKDNSSLTIEIEGHCDERGGVQYNLALGEQRAKAVRRFLINEGVSSRRVKTVSYGKERPISFGHDEAAWGQNRRANFVITAK